MSDYVASVSTEFLQTRLRGFGEKFRQRILQVVTRLSLELQRKVKEEKLTGQVLHVRTGTLRRSINREVQDDGSRIGAVVGTNVSYAAAHEYGFHGQVQVKEHLRSIKQAWGRPLREPKEVLVRAHSMNVNLPERSFLRSALADMAERIRDELKRAAGEAVKA